MEWIPDVQDAAPLSLLKLLITVTTNHWGILLVRAVIEKGPELHLRVVCLCLLVLWKLNKRTHARTHARTHTHTHTRFTALFPGLPRWASTRRIQPISILVKQETVSDSGISWAICQSAPCSRQTTTSAPHPDALPAGQPTASKHVRLWKLNSLSNQHQSRDIAHGKPWCWDEKVKGRACMRRGSARWPNGRFF